MFRTVKIIAISGLVVGALAGGTVAHAATPPAATNDMTRGNGGGMMGGDGMMGGNGMMGDHGKTNANSSGDMMGMMSMMTSCTNLMTAQINMMNAMTNEINAQTKLLNQDATSGAGAAPK
jgi:hypothetical protein